MRNGSRLATPSALLVGAPLLGLHACRAAGSDPVGVWNGRHGRTKMLRKLTVTPN
jgi:hypothetical protein